jgi:hypothetical protein
MKISTGASESHETPLPLDASGLPGVQAPTAIAPGETVQGAVRDLTGERLAQLAAGTADASAAMAAGMAADSDRRGRYATSMAPMGASYGDLLPLPEPVPEQVTSPASDSLYGQGDQPGA